MTEGQKQFRQEEDLQHEELSGDPPVSLKRAEMDRIERALNDYVPEHLQEDASQDMCNLLEEMLQEKLRTQKIWYKAVPLIGDAAFCEVLQAQLEARKRRLDPSWQSETPRG